MIPPVSWHAPPTRHFPIIVGLTDFDDTSQTFGFAGLQIRSIFISNLRKVIRGPN